MERYLRELAPYAGAAHYYLYEGGSYEKNRIGNSYAIHLFTGGTGSITVAEERFSIKEGDLLFIRPGTPHSIHAQATNPLPSFNLYADLWEEQHPVSCKPQVHLSVAEAKLVAANAIHSSELNQIPVRLSLKNTWFTESLIQIVRLLNGREQNKQLTANLLLHAWLLRLYAHITNPGPRDSRIIALLEVLESQEGCRLSVDEMAKFCKLGRSRFFKLFRQETGVTPTDYLLQLRMKQAAVLLRMGGINVSEVAEKLGYDSIHYFSRQFTAYHGVNPSAYR